MPHSNPQRLCNLQFRSTICNSAHTVLNMSRVIEQTFKESSFKTFSSFSKGDALNKNMSEENYGQRKEREKDEKKLRERESREKARAMTQKLELSLCSLLPILVCLTGTGSARGN